jgi:putative transcriptional regulator
MDTGRQSELYSTRIYVSRIIAFMVKLRLNEILEERGKSMLWLSKKIRVRYATLWQMSRNEVVLVNLKTLDKICKALDVEPGELLTRTLKRKRR